MDSRAMQPCRLAAMAARFKLERPWPEASLQVRGHGHQVLSLQLLARGRRTQSSSSRGHRVASSRTRSSRPSPASLTELTRSGRTTPTTATDEPKPLVPSREPIVHG
ncbi:uncharacterized protein J3R85_010214 [Psidium guajava]|nr:uncharacterized protein J3R85_010214 [Psidium guajava]